MNIPCKECISFAICNAKVIRKKNHLSPLCNIYACSLLNLYKIDNKIIWRRKYIAILETFGVYDNVNYQKSKIKNDNTL